ncbi:hypothetical protein A11A3_06395 [Alcanivorax hongdengensis A-11-3]|uniref:DUF2505 domain-containing protein n=1 Tax=Alcanivorax hongdengensis A-11-3 TaxID=1177179 RepID=L0WG94_9GAMM|nr:DUF2505 domain-containing protein [Alcanivorax hongdengensis]EKF74840.1 hypothetical protein A11A3_06395 [Alcanivorax hongdengensis A-11-3]
MKVTVDRQFDIGVDRMYEIFTSKDFFEQRFAWGKVHDYRFDAFERTAGGFLVRIIQPVSIRTDKVPGFARKLLPSRADLLTEFLWHSQDDAGPHQADYRFQLGNVPVKVSGIMRLAGDGQQCRQHTQVEVSSSVPLVGRKLVELIAPKVDDALEGDYRQTRRYLEQCL